MTAYSLKFAKDNLERIAQETVRNSDETIITLDSGEAVVMIPMEQYEAWKETQLLMTPANRRHLLASMEQYRQGRTTHKSLADLQADAPE
ncbi:type II toxin-antitoxin system Phd/YefM family antitoxin [Deinococcus aquaedulcis]|uniref:type II toxin-antitoxin system Phd/YefM family antitoxin n=1 Tax=Deinococcus aquaedulcis TaxID=2840455 RepID=UPI001C82ABAC|nr:type II toxin-antitoxin system Phd/YefM family antitoxin [Deinococcus aquaedulcis]